MNKKIRKYDDGIERPYFYKWRVQLRSCEVNHPFNFIEGWFTGKEIDFFITHGYEVRELDSAIVYKGSK